MSYRFRQKILFKHCDPAGIVFFPRCVEIINDAVEDWFDEGLGQPFEQLHDSGAVPTVKIEVEFDSPSRHGDVLDLDLGIKKIGRTSVTVQIVGRCNDETRFTSISTLVSVDQGMKPTPWSEDLRKRMKPYLV